MSKTRVNQLSPLDDSVVIDVRDLASAGVQFSSVSSLKNYDVTKSSAATITQGATTGLFARKTGVLPVMSDDNNYIASATPGYYWERVSKSSATPRNYFVGMYWRNDADTSTDLYTSQDGVFFSRVSGGRLRYNSGVAMAGRDNDLFYWKGYWYTTNTNYGSDGSGAWDFYVYRSQDLQNWTLYKCKLGANAKYNTSTSTVGGAVPTNFLWAPKFYVNNGELYVSISIRYGADTTNYLGGSIMSFQTFISQVTNLNNLTFGEPVKVGGTALTSCYIDSHIYNVGSEWWLLCQNSVTQRIEIFKSSSPTSFNTAPISITSSVYVEAPSLLRVYNPDSSVTLKIQADSGNGYYSSVSNDGGISWSTFSVQQFQYNVRHGTTINLMDVSDSASAIATFERFKSYAGDGSQTSISYSIDISTLIGNTPGQVDLNPLDDALYYIGNASLNVNISGRVARRFYVVVKSGLSTSGLTFLQSGYFPRNNAAIGYGKSNDTIFEIRLSDMDGQYYICAPAKAGCVVAATKNGTDQSVSTGVQTKVTFTATTFQHGQAYSTANSRLTVPSGVRAKLSATVMITGGLVAGQALIMRVIANGSAVYKEVVTPAVSNGNQSISIDALILGDGTTYHEVFVTLNGSATLTINGDASRSFVNIHEV